MAATADHDLVITAIHTGRGYQITPACFRRIVVFVFRGNCPEDDGRRLVAGRFATNTAQKGSRDNRIDALTDVKAVVGKEPSATVEGSRHRKIVVRMYVMTEEVVVVVVAALLVVGVVVVVVVVVVVGEYHV